MSSRALRKLEREHDRLKQSEVIDELEKQEDETEAEAKQAKASAVNGLNAFDMLIEELEDENEDGMSDADNLIAAEKHSLSEDTMRHGSPSIEPEKPKAKSKSKKKKSKKKAKEVEKPEYCAKPTKPLRKAPPMDEIDLALQYLSKTSKDDPQASTRAKTEEANLRLYRLLAVESKHLNALNEMKRLFGNVVLENEDDTAGNPRRRGRGPRQLDLGGALAGRNSPISRGQGLAGLALRRNPFILGKEVWPKATSGGLGMALVEKMEDNTVEYRFVHNTLYQDVQRQFETCVESMDPHRMIQMLQFNRENTCLWMFQNNSNQIIAYHISTLLQVSEIAKHQGDHSVSGDLLERALFSFGRSVHSSFATALSEGKARLDFRRPENREFWLAAWRYMNNLGQRGTWRTAYEWAKLVLSLDPEGDPYAVVLVLDQLALRGGQSEQFLEMSQHPFFADDLWRTRPNIDISAALAKYKLKKAQECRVTLSKAVSKYPWIFVRLFQELNINHVPKTIWGHTPRTKRERFECELYIHNAKDLWNTPEATSFLVEVVESVKLDTSTAPAITSITPDEARHVLLSGVPVLINEVPRDYTTSPSSASDPLPPIDNLPAYDPHPTSNNQPRQTYVFEPPGDFDTPPEPETPNPRSPEDNERSLQEEQEYQGTLGFFRRFIPWLGSGQPPVEPTESVIEGIEQRAAELGIPRELIAERGARALELDRRGRGNGSEEAPDRGAYLDNEAQENENHLSRQLGTGSSQGSEAHEPYDDDRNQRWLAGQGMIKLRDFCNQHGTDEGSWPKECHPTPDIVTEYARRMQQLRQMRTQNFIMDYVLPQGASQDVKALIKREIDRVGGGMADHFPSSMPSVDRTPD